MAMVAVAALCMVVAGCRGDGQGEPAGAQQESTPKPEPAKHQGTEPARNQEAEPAQPTEEGMRKEAPEPLLMEMWVTRPMTRPSGRRILADGTWWHYTNTDFEQFQDPDTQEWRMRPVRIEEGWWDSECRLSPEELTKLKDEIRASGVMDLPAETPPSPGGVIGGSDVYYTFEIDGKRHRIHFLEGGDQRPDPINHVRDLASKMIFNSQQRRLRDQGESHSPLVDY